MFVSRLIEKVGKTINYIGTLVWVKWDRDFVFLVAIEKSVDEGRIFVRSFFFIQGI